MDPFEDKRWGYLKIVPFGKWFWAETPEAWRVFEHWASAAEWLKAEVEEHQRRKECEKVTS